MNRTQISAQTDEFCVPHGRGDEPIELGNGHIAELQLTSPMMLQAKEGLGHRLYEVMRDVYPLLRNTEPGAQFYELVDLFRTAEETSQKLYNAAFNADNILPSSPDASLAFDSEMRELWRTMSAASEPFLTSRILPDKILKTLNELRSSANIVPESLSKNLQSGTVPPPDKLIAQVGEDVDEKIEAIPGTSTPNITLIPPAEPDLQAKQPTPPELPPGTTPIPQPEDPGIIQMCNVGPDTTQNVQDFANTLLEVARPGVMKKFWDDIQDRVSIEPVPRLARVANWLANKAVEHASARIAAPKMVNGLLSSIFPDSYRNAPEMAKTIDIIVKDNVLGIWDSLNKRAQDAQAAGETDAGRMEQKAATAVDAEMAGKYQAKADAIREAAAAKADDWLEKAHALVRVGEQPGTMGSSSIPFSCPRARGRA